MKRCLISLVIVTSIIISCKNNPQKTRIEENVSNDSTSISIDWDSSYIITSSQAFRTDKGFELQIDGLNIDFQNRENRWFASINQVALADCLFVSSQFRMLKQSIKLNKDQVDIGDKLLGFIELLTLGKKAFFREPEIPFVDKRNWDTIRIKGFFSAIVK